MEPQSNEYQIHKFRERPCIILKLPFLSNHMSILTPPSSNSYTELQQILSNTGRLTDMALPDGNCFFAQYLRSYLEHKHIMLP